MKKRYHTIAVGQRRGSEVKWSGGRRSEGLGTSETSTHSRRVVHNPTVLWVCDKNLFPSFGKNNNTRALLWWGREGKGSHTGLPILEFCGGRFSFGGGHVSSWKNGAAKASESECSERILEYKIFGPWLAREERYQNLAAFVLWCGWQINCRVWLGSSEVTVMCPSVPQPLSNLELAVG